MKRDHEGMKDRTYEAEDSIRKKKMKKDTEGWCKRRPVGRVFLPSWGAPNSLVGEGGFVWSVCGVPPVRA